MAGSVFALVAGRRGEVGVGVLARPDEAVLDDSSFDVWGELQPALAEAIAQTLDAAVFGGINKPASWPAASVPAARTAGNAVELGTATPQQGGGGGDIESAFDQVEADGYTVSGVAAVTAMRDCSARPVTRRGSGSLIRAAT
jgi:hypothetical protein